jgi:hypothetical protein
LNFYTANNLILNYSVAFSGAEFDQLAGYLRGYVYEISVYFGVFGGNIISVIVS